MKLKIKVKETYKIFSCILIFKTTFYIMNFNNKSLKASFQTNLFIFLYLKLED